MDEIAIGLGLLVAGAVIVFVGWPWWAGRKNFQAELRPENRPLRNAQDETLANRRETVLNALRDLDFDHAVGKVTAEDYGPLRQALLFEAANIIAQLDSKRAAAETELDTYIEVDRSAVHPPQPANNGSCPACGQAARPGAFYCTTCGTRLPLTCPKCGQIIHSADRFCPSCGTEVVSELFPKMERAT